MSCKVRRVVLLTPSIPRDRSCTATIEDVRGIACITDTLRQDVSVHGLARDVLLVLVALLVSNCIDVTRSSLSLTSAIVRNLHL